MHIHLGFVFLIRNTHHLVQSPNYKLNLILILVTIKCNEYILYSKVKTFWEASFLFSFELHIIQISNRIVLPQFALIINPILPSAFIIDSCSRKFSRLSYPNHVDLRQSGKQLLKQSCFQDLEFNSMIILHFYFQHLLLFQSF